MGRDVDERRWKEVSRLYHEAARRSAGDRDVFLEQACAGDDALRDEVVSLLADTSAVSDFLAVPAPSLAGVLGAVLEADLVSLVGRRLGPYRIDALLGAGGMGEVYRATDTRLHRTVALKILPQHLRELPHLRARFEREARAVAALQHPQICVLHDIGEDEGIEFLVMELLDGETLAERLARGPLSRDELFRYAIHIVDALAETHRQNIVHGDLKPGNIMLTAGGAKLLDFGLATLTPGGLGGDGGAPADGRNASRTAAIGGTLPYMAPEQLQGRASDRRSDVFAFGAILYEMVSAKKAFDGRVAGTIPDGEPVPTLGPEAPGWSRNLEPFIERSVARDPDARWPRTSDMAEELRRISILSDAAGPKPRGRRERGTGPVWWRLSLAALLLLAAFGWGSVTWGWFGVRQPAVADERATPLVFGNMRQLTADDRLEIDPTFSPDGRHVAYAAGTAAAMRIFVRDVAGGTPRPLTADPDALQFHPRWSPDGRRILYVTLDGAFVVPATGGTPERVDSQADRAGSYSATTPSNARRIYSGAIWSPDGRRIAIAYGGSLSIVPIDHAGERRLLDGSPYELHSCDWSPNDRWIACVAGNWSFPGPGGYFGNVSPSALVLFPTTPGPSIDIMRRTAVHRSPAWSADGRRLYFVSSLSGPNDIYSIEISAEGAAVGDARRETTGLGVYSMTFSSSRQSLAYAAYSAQARIWALPIPAAGTVDLSGARAVTRGNQTIEAMRVTRDKRWLLYDSDLHGNFDIFRMPIDGGDAERLTDDPAHEFAPDLSRDGVLAYHSWRTMSRDIFIERPGAEKPDQLTSSPSQESLPAWSPDGLSIAFLDQLVEHGVSRGAFLIRRDRSGQWSPPEPLRTDTSRVSWSPDGRLLAYARRGAVEILPLRSRQPTTVYAPVVQNVDPSAEAVQFGEDEKTLYFRSRDALGRASLWSVPVSGAGKPAHLVRMHDPERQSSRTEFAVGRGHFYFTIEDRRSNIWVADITGR